MLSLKKLKLNKNSIFTIISSIIVICSALHLFHRYCAYTQVPSCQIVSGIPKVIDGDSIKIQNIEMRLLGIDAPEFLQTCGEKSNIYSCGKKAKAHLLELINNRPITCKYCKFDKYHRALANCFVEHDFLNREMVKDGWAVSYYNFKELERKARKAKLGIWASSFEWPKNWRKTHHHDSHRALANEHLFN